MTHKSQIQAPLILMIYDVINNPSLSESVVHNES